MRKLAWLTLLAAACAEAPPDAAGIARFTVRGRVADPRALSWSFDGEDYVREQIAGALAVWERTGVVAFSPHSGDGTPDVVFAFADPSDVASAESPFGRDTSVAATGPVGPGCTVLFDPSREWDVPGRGPSLHLAAVHEIGHVLGLGHNEDRTSALHPQREVAASSPGAGDLDGLHSLYGGGRDGPGDLEIEGDTPDLRRVAPAHLAGWTLFDTDGDGDDEVLVWARKENEPGPLIAYHFGPGPRLERTVGPLGGVVGYGARVEPGADAARRWLDVFTQDGTALRWSLGSDGVPHAPAEIPWRDGPAESPGAASGDLDGDGRRERVTARR